LCRFRYCRGEEAVDQQSGHVTALEGGLVTLSCNYTTSSPSPDLFWYIQLTRDTPQYVLRRDRYSEGSNSDKFKKRFDSRMNFTSSSVPLTIQRLQLSDSAVYYCALRPTVTTGYTAPLQKLFDSLILYKTLRVPCVSSSLMFPKAELRKCFHKPMRQVFSLLISQNAWSPG
uniref:Ig-like domain-containing protein n=1 Tax=Oncorhynchus mykiss TaxID=8022 RepID=A0A8C7LV08_ONCMY